MFAEILSIGNELLSGLTVNSNASFIGETLLQCGIPVRRTTVVGDRNDDILTALRQALSRASVVIITGGLGPTHDDITRHAIAEFLQVPLVFNSEAYQKVAQHFIRRNEVPPESNKIQAHFPEGTDILNNSLGTAPGFSFQTQNARCFVLPGVPKEMKTMLVQEVLPLIKDLGEAHIARVFKVSGISESLLFEKIRDLVLDMEAAHIQVAFLPGPTGIVLRLFTQKSNASVLSGRIPLLLDQAGEWIYGEENDTMESVVGQLLLDQQKTIAVAESCTGGLIGHKLTNVPGSSAYFDRGVLTYSNEAKEELLGVPGTTLEQFGAVSEQTAKAMAQGVRKLSRASIGLSVTGIAGPGGGSETKPVGLVYVGYADENKGFAKGFTFFTDRLVNKERFAMAALDVVRRELLGLPQNCL